MIPPLDALTTPFSLSLLTAARGNASKRLVPDAHGKPMRDPAHRLGISTGRVEHVHVAGLPGLVDLLEHVSRKQALVHGIPIGSAPCEAFQLVVCSTSMPSLMSLTTNAPSTPPW